MARKPITMLQAPSVKPQATLTTDQGSCRMNIESEEIYMSMDSENYQTVQLKRIADILEEILKLVKKDMGVK